MGGYDMRDKNIPYEYEPISMWGYFGYEILFSIPIIGFIVLLVYAFGGTRNINLRNFFKYFLSCHQFYVNFKCIICAKVDGSVLFQWYKYS